MNKFGGFFEYDRRKDELRSIEEDIDANPEFWSNPELSAETLKKKKIIEGAIQRAERLRSAVEIAPIPFGEKQPLGFMSISVGVASYPSDGDTTDKVLKAADEGVYQSKHGGRNRVTLFHEIPQGKKASGT